MSKKHEPYLLADPYRTAFVTVQPCKPPEDKDGDFDLYTQEVKAREEWNEYLVALNRYYEDPTPRNKQLLAEEIADCQTAGETMLAGLYNENGRQQVHMQVNLKNSLRGLLPNPLDKFKEALKHGWWNDN